MRGHLKFTGPTIMPHTDLAPRHPDGTHIDHEKAAGHIPAMVDSYRSGEYRLLSLKTVLLDDGTELVIAHRERMR